jgi:Tetratricopeptide repeat
VNDARDKGEQRWWAERVVRAVNKAFPSVQFSSWSKCERLLLHAQACAALIGEFGFDFPEAARLLNEAGSYLCERARYAEVEPLYLCSLAIRDKLLAPDHPGVAVGLNRLGPQAQGKDAQAEPLYQRSLAIWEKALGPDHPKAKLVRSNLDALRTSTRRQVLR